MAQDMNRPKALTEMSVSQMNDLEQWFTESDRGSFDTLTQSFGWTKDQADEVWNWFNQRPPDKSGFASVSP